MNIKRIVLSGFNMSSNCYILNKDNRAVVIDPGFDDIELYNYLTNKELDVEAIILTHGHFDHWGGYKKLSKLYPNAHTYASSLDYKWYEIGDNNPYGYTPQFDFDLNKLKTIKLLGDTYKVIKTPGHSAGSVSLYNKLKLFSGDVLFMQSIGRYDLMDGNIEVLLDSIKLLYSLDNDTIIYPGHGRDTTIGFEKRSNPFIKG